MGDFIPTLTTLTETECSQVQPLHTASDVLSAQVGMRGSLRNMYGSLKLHSDSIKLNFKFEAMGSNSTYHCVFWDFSDP